MPKTKTPPTTIPELIDAFGGPTGFAKVIDKNPSTASEMKRSAAIRVSYWPAIVAAAPEHDVPGVTLESIAQMHVNSPAKESAA
jgi:hypothetical protein